MDASWFRPDEVSFILSFICPSERYGSTGNQRVVYAIAVHPAVKMSGADGSITFFATFWPPWQWVAREIQLVMERNACFHWSHNVSWRIFPWRLKKVGGRGSIADRLIALEQRLFPGMITKFHVFDLVCKWMWCFQLNHKSNSRLNLAGVIHLEDIYLMVYKNC